MKLPENMNNNLRVAGVQKKLLAFLCSSSYEINQPLLDYMLEL